MEQTPILKDSVKLIAIHRGIEGNHNYFESFLNEEQNRKQEKCNFTIL
jgi:hypothetical protein